MNGPQPADWCIKQGKLAGIITVTSGLVGSIRAAWIVLARFPYSSIHTCAYEYTIELPNFFLAMATFRVCLVRTTPVFTKLINQCLTDLCAYGPQTRGPPHPIFLFLTECTVRTQSFQRWAEVIGVAS